MPDREWMNQAIRRLDADSLRTADTHLERMIQAPDALNLAAMCRFLETGQWDAALSQSYHDRVGSRRN